MHPEAPEGFFKTESMAKKSKAKLTQLPKTILRFIKEARDELKKVSWPNRQTTVRYTIIVIATSIIVGIVIGSVDYFFSLILEQVI